MNPACVGCVHYYGYYRDNKCCNYIFDTGHRRPCPPGAACTVKKLRPQKGGAETASKGSEIAPKHYTNPEDV